MIPAKLPPDESERLKKLQEYNILDTPPEIDFDSLVQLAARICGTPISLISLVDSHRQWFKARYGLDATETPREMAFCSHAILGNEPFVVKDASRDERFHDNPLVVEDPSIRFYAGMPLRTPEGHSLGTLCVIDKTPRELNELQAFTLSKLADQVIQLFEQRRYSRRLHENQVLNSRISAMLGQGLQEPVNSTSLLLQLLDQSGELTPGLRSTIPALQGQLREARLAMQHFERWMKLQEPAGPPRKQLFHLGDLLSSVTHSLKDLAQTKSTRFLCQVGAPDCQPCEQNDIPEASLMNLPLDTVRFMLFSLLHNSLKYSESGEITIRAKELGDELELLIEDKGPGIPDALLPVLGNRLPEDITPGTRGERGLGLGLLLCGIYANHIGATLSFANTKPGLSVRLTLPLHQPAAVPV